MGRLPVHTAVWAAVGCLLAAPGAGAASPEAPAVMKVRIAEAPAKPAAGQPEDHARLARVPKDGVWSHGDSEGRILGRGEFRGGSRNGKSVRWFQKGEGRMFSGRMYQGFEPPFNSEAEFVDGVLEGTWTVTDGQGRRASQWEFRGGQPHGTSTWWYADGTLRQRFEYRWGQVYGRIQQWDTHGKLVVDHEEVNGKRLQRTEAWYAPNQPSFRGAYVLGDKVIRHSFDWWEGIAEADLVREEKVRQKHGVWTWWYPSGEKRMECRYEEGRPVGTFTWWYPTGQKQHETPYDHGRLDGPVLWWHENGQKRMQANYRGGLPTGPPTRWSPDGQVIREPREAPQATAAPRHASRPEKSAAK